MKPYPLSEDQIERRVESAIDALDRRLMSGEIDQSQYDQEVSIIDKWAQQQYAYSRDHGAFEAALGSCGK